MADVAGTRCRRANSPGRGAALADSAQHLRRKNSKLDMIGLIWAAIFPASW